MYKLLSFALLFCLIYCSTSAQVPLPVKMDIQKGHFLLTSTTTILADSKDNAVQHAISFFNKELQMLTGLHLKINNKTKLSHYLTLWINTKWDSIISKEGYQLQVTSSGIKLEANTDAGLFYGLQTLLQLIPAESNRQQFLIPCSAITDYPRFGWRGLMLDVSRHFFSKEEVKQYIDEMVQYKFNVFHWHLSDDEGWRIEIKSLPQLTKVGAWRVPRTGLFGNFALPQPGEAATYGGYYTQEDIKEIVQYAKDRFVTIVPEIDVPAHSLAMIASYPNLSCTQQIYPVDPGTDFYEKEDNALCVGNDSVFTMLDKVFTEIAALFPGSYIHVGGDEAFKGFWKTCPKCQKRMQQEQLQNVDELQSYFVKRVEKIIESKGKKMIGWDEILDGGLAPNAAVMSWRGMKGGIAAAKMQHNVVMSPWGNSYLDLYQSDSSAEPPTYGMCRLTNCYQYDPVPDGVDAQYILGGQGNLWAEMIPNYRQAQYMTWPRAMALAEVYWSPKEKRDWDGFIKRMEAQFPRLDQQHIKYARSYYNAIIQPVKDEQGNRYVQLSTEIKGLDIYYSFDNTNPDNYYPKYEGKPLAFPVGATLLKVITYRDGKPIGQQVSLKKTDLDKMNIK